MNDAHLVVHHGGTQPVPLTRLEADAMRVIQEWIDSTGMAPSRGELARELGMASRASVQRVVDNLSAKGWLRRHALMARGLAILHRVPDAPQEVAVELTAAGRAAAEGGAP